MHTQGLLFSSEACALHRLCPGGCAMRPQPRLANLVGRGPTRRRILTAVLAPRWARGTEATPFPAVGSRSMSLARTYASRPCGLEASEGKRSRRSAGSSESRASRKSFTSANISARGSADGNGPAWMRSARPSRRPRRLEHRWAGPAMARLQRLDALLPNKEMTHASVARGAARASAVDRHQIGLVLLGADRSAFSQKHARRSLRGGLYGRSGTERRGAFRVLGCEQCVQMNIMCMVPIAVYAYGSGASYVS
ncbi:hypothetical protein B0H21DRAFT_338418 [Amylocystis lapponica]|nr:hypothetical protein B0H21DRAFT_338418 [Amylocystis lapponica]